MSHQQIVPFLFEGEGLLRVIDREARPWFVAADVCRLIDVKNPTQAVSALDGDERAMFNIGPQGEVNIVSEGGLYTIVLRSRDATNRKRAAWRIIRSQG